MMELGTTAPSCRSFPALFAIHNALVPFEYRWKALGCWPVVLVGVCALVLPPRLATRSTCLQHCSSLLRISAVGVQAESIPGFADSPSVCGHAVPFCRKAQLLAADLHARFAAESPLFDFEDAASLGPDTGASAIAYVRSHGCLECSSEVSKAIADRVELKKGEKEGSLRAACDVATRMIAAELNVDTWRLSRWIQLYAIKTDNLVSHMTRRTPAY